MGLKLRHTSHAYEDELQQLREAIVAMGDLCQQGLATALDAFRDGTAEDTRSVQGLDRRIDAAEMAIDALVVRILALRQPVASDLRLLTMALKLVKDLERIGDEAVNIAERSLDRRCELSPAIHEVLDKLLAETQHMVASALASFVTEDVERAEEVLSHDDIVDELYGRTMRAMEEYMARHPTTIRAALSIMSVAKYLERVADHATNIAEEVIYLVRGEDVRHSGSVALLRLVSGASPP